MSYAADRIDLARRAALYIDKILKGANPADLPVEQASKFQLAINLKTANSAHISSLRCGRPAAPAQRSIPFGMSLIIGMIVYFCEFH